MHCVFIGDSIAQGVAQYRPECQNQAVVGRTLGQALLRVHQVPSGADHVIISVGSNDRRTSISELRSQIQKLRNQLAHHCVTWLLPPDHPAARKLINKTAADYGDRVIDVKPQLNPDQDPVHPGPQGYQRLAVLTQHSSCETIVLP